MYTTIQAGILRIAKGDSSSGMRIQKLVTGAIVKTVGYDVHSVQTAVIMNIPRSEYHCAHHNPQV